jgi:CRISPR system Cascade subunit CasD
MRALLLRLDAPLMSFGGVTVDQHNRTDPLPYRAMLTGLLANALGYERREEGRLESLQARLRYAARRDRRGAALVDYQTVDLGSGPMAAGLGWTTRGQLEERKGGEASDGTHIRYRHYLADAIVTVALTLDPDDADPTLSEVASALQAPARPLFLGRKCCIPSAPVWLGEVETVSLREAISTFPRAPTLRPGDRDRSDAGPLQAVWLPTEGGNEPTRLWPRVEDRDMANAIHTGRRLYVEGLVDPPVRASSREEKP